MTGRIAPFSVGWPPGSAPPGRPAVAVVSELVLLAESVGSGLSRQGFTASVRELSGTWAEGHAVDGADVGLLISDLSRWEDVRAAWRLVTSVPLPWIVVTEAPQGPLWGAVLDAGAEVVIPSTSGLDRVSRIVAGVAAGRVRAPAADRDALVGQWADLLQRREEISQQVSTLTPREREVLSMLHAGDRIVRIAQLLGISPVTVRSQVKAVLRKLDVKSQLAAVAALDDLLALGSWAPGEAIPDEAGEASPNCGMSRLPARAW